MLLGDLGAEVIKVEPPVGDQVRFVFGRRMADSPYFVSINRNKRSMCVDLASEAARPVVGRHRRSTSTRTKCSPSSASPRTKPRSYGPTAPSARVTPSCTYDQSRQQGDSGARPRELAALTERSETERSAAERG